MGRLTLEDYTSFPNTFTTLVELNNKVLDILQIKSQSLNSNIKKRSLVLVLTKVSKQTQTLTSTEVVVRVTIQAP